MLYGCQLSALCCNWGNLFCNEVTGMKEIVHIILEDLTSYNGKSFLFVLFFIGLVILGFLERKRSFRTVFLYLSIGLFLVFINPLYAWIGTKVDTEIYYRVLWTLPVGIVVCYAAVKAFESVKKKWAKGIVLLLTLILMLVNGDCVYEKTLHVKSTNPYHIPQVVIHIGDALEMERFQPTVVMPAELLPFIKEYSGDIRMPYGRNILESAWSFSHELFDAMEAEEYDIEKIAQYAKECQCLYVLLSCAKTQNGNMEDYDYTYIDFVDGYYIYMDNAIYKELVRMDLLAEDEFVMINEP